MIHIDENLHKALLNNGYIFLKSGARNEDGTEAVYEYTNGNFILSVYTDEKTEYPEIITEQTSHSIGELLKKYKI